ncbi:MAG: DUF4249 domain-containing protein [Bacteroidales bacterium]|nr:DUF4249 domain-containing protein [Bacteroidales bacterium]
MMLVLAVATSLFGCENTVDYDAALQTPTLVMNGFLDASQTFNIIMVAVTGETAPEIPGNPIVQLYRNGRQITTELVTSPEFSIYPQCIAAMQMQAGDKIRVEATANSAVGRLMAWAEDVVPEAPAISRIAISRPNTKDISTFSASVTFTDVPNTENYYRLLIEGYVEISGASTFTANDTVITYTMPCDLDTGADPILNRGHISGGGEALWLLEQAENKAAVFDDSMLNGEQTLTVTNKNAIHFEYADTRDIIDRYFRYYIKVRLQAITSAEYHYMSVWNTYASDSYEPVLGGPIHFPSNVNGGTGIVGISNEAVAMELIMESAMPWN